MTWMQSLHRRFLCVRENYCEIEQYIFTISIRCDTLSLGKNIDKKYKYDKMQLESSCRDEGFLYE